MFKKVATLPGNTAAKKSIALIHNCIGNILSMPIVGNKNDTSEKNPLINKKANKIIRNLFMLYNKYIILYYKIRT